MTGETQSGNASKKLWMAAPILLVALIYFLSTTTRGVIDYDEGYYAQPARHMVESGDWVTPYVNGVRFLEKPPFLYWVTAASFKLFGINEFALRLPTVLAVIAIVWVVMLMARRASNERTALIAGLSTAFSVGMYIFTRETLHDIWLVFFICLAMYAFLEWYLDSRHPARSALLFYFAMAGGMLCKSLIGVAFPIGIVILFFLLSRERPRWRSLHIVPGGILFLLLTVPWHWLAASRNEGFLDFFFVGEQFLRFFGKREPPVLWSMPVWTFWALVLVWLFPWTAFLPAAIARCRKLPDKHERLLLKLAISWAGVIMLFFSVSSRLEHYALPVLPALSLIIAIALSQNGESKSILWGFRGLAVLGILVVLIGGGFIWYTTVHGFQSSESGPSNILASTDFSIMGEMPSSIVENLLTPAAVTILSLAIGFGIALWFEVRHRRIHAVMSLAVVMMVVCGAIHWSFTVCEDLISSKKFALAVAREARSDDRLIVVGDYESANSLSFYNSLPVEVFDGTAYALIPGMKYPDAPKIVLTQQEFQAAWQSHRRTFVLVPEARLKDLKLDGIEMMSLLHRVLERNH